MTIWNFSPRIHPSDIPTRLIRRLIDDMPQRRRHQGRRRLPEHPERGRVPPALRRRGRHLGAHRGRPDPAVTSDPDPALGDQRPRVLRAGDPAGDAAAPRTASTTTRPRSSGGCIPPGRSRRRCSRGCTADPSSTARRGSSRAGCRATTAARCASRRCACRTTRWPRCARASSTPASSRPWTRSGSSSSAAIPA